MWHTVLQLTSIVLSPSPCSQIPKSPIEQTGKWITILQCGKHCEVNLPGTLWELWGNTTWSAEESWGKDSLREEPDKKQVKGNLGRGTVGKSHRNQKHWPFIGRAQISGRRWGQWYWREKAEIRLQKPVHWTVPQQGLRELIHRKEHSSLVSCL